MIARAAPWCSSAPAPFRCGACSRHFVERGVGAGQDGIPLREGLPAPDRDIDIKRVEIDAEADAADSLSSHERRARSKEGVEHNVAAPRQSRMASAIMSTGLTVGCDASSSSRSAPNEFRPR